MTSVKMHLFVDQFNLVFASTLVDQPAVPLPAVGDTLTFRDSDGQGDPRYRADVTEVRLFVDLQGAEIDLQLSQRLEATDIDAGGSDEGRLRECLRDLGWTVYEDKVLGPRGSERADLHDGATDELNDMLAEAGIDPVEPT